MSLKVCLSLCTIFVVWSSVSGKVYELRGTRPLATSSCWTAEQHGEGETPHPVEEPLHDFSFDSLNENTTIIVYGIFEQYTGSGGLLQYFEMRLDNYWTVYGKKSYGGERQWAYENPVLSQMTKIGIIVEFIPQTRQTQFIHTVYARSFMACSCATAKSVITDVEIIV